MSEENAGGTVENPTVEELASQLEAKDQALAKAEAKIVEMKKSTKEVEPKEEAPVAEPKVLDESMIQGILAKEKFLDANPEIREFEEDFTKLTSQWVSVEVAKAEILARNPEIANRQKTNSLGMTWELPSADKTTYTEEEFVQIAWTNQPLYNQLVAKKQKGEITITK